MTEQVAMRENFLNLNSLHASFVPFSGDLRKRGFVYSEISHGCHIRGALNV